MHFRTDRESRISDYTISVHSDSAIFQHIPQFARILTIIPGARTIVPRPNNCTIDTETKNSCNKGRVEPSVVVSILLISIRRSFNSVVFSINEPKPFILYG